MYDRACFVVTNEEIADTDENYRTLGPDLGATTFLDGLRRHVRAYYFD